MSAEHSAESDRGPNYRLWWEQSERRRAEIERILDRELGTEEDAGAGQGLVADVLLAIQKAWEEGFGAGEHMARCWGHVDHWEPPYPVNPYRVTPPARPVD